MTLRQLQFWFLTQAQSQRKICSCVHIKKKTLNNRFSSDLLVVFKRLLTDGVQSNWEAAKQECKMLVIVRYLNWGKKTKKHFAFDFTEEQVGVTLLYIIHFWFNFKMSRLILCLHFVFFCMCYSVFKNRNQECSKKRKKRRRTRSTCRRDRSFLSHAFRWS